jgi:hypothetical protein
MHLPAQVGPLPKRQRGPYGNSTATATSRETKKSAGANRLTLVFLGSPTWARTRDLRINRRSVGSGCRPRQCSLSGVRTSNTFESVSSISTGLERRIDYWILESFPPRMPGCSAALVSQISAWPQSNCMRAGRVLLRDTKSRSDHKLQMAPSIPSLGQD